MPAIANLISINKGVPYTFALNTLDSYIANRENFVRPYLLELKNQGIDYGNIWIDSNKKEYSKLLAVIDKLITIGFISQQVRKVYRCKCGKVELLDCEILNKKARLLKMRSLNLEKKIQDFLDYRNTPVFQLLKQRRVLWDKELQILSGVAIGLKNIGNSISNVYCILGEGCLEEGISYESMSLAGALQLSNLVVLYDSNKTSIDGETYETFPDDMQERLRSINWEYEYIGDGDDVNAILSALNKARRKPLFIEVSSKIAKGLLLEGNFITHGRPLGNLVTSKISGYKDN